MKVLLISDNAIFGYGGGSLEEHKYYDGIKEFVSKNGGEFKVISIDEPFEQSLTPKFYKKKSYDYLSRLLGHSTYMYFIWKKYRNMVYDYDPDVVFLGRSRLGFIAKEFKKKHSKALIVCNMENVEFDYVDAYFANSHSFLKKLYVKLEKRCTYFDEASAVAGSCAINYLTYRDFVRTHELYKPENKIETTLPICVSKAVKLHKTTPKPTVVFIGSLGYESNSSSLFKFIDEVWTPYYKDNKNIDFIVAGSNPSIQLEKTLDSVPNAVLYKNFSKLEDIIPRNAMIIAPIKKGAGMKVKVAESLSMGLMIAASDEALVGYEEALRDCNTGIVRVNTPGEYKKSIDRYFNLSPDELLEIEKQNIELFEKYYKYSRSRRVIADLLKILIEKRFDENNEK